MNIGEWVFWRARQAFGMGHYIYSVNTGMRHHAPGQSGEFRCGQGLD